MKHLALASTILAAACLAAPSHAQEVKDPPTQSEFPPAEAERVDELTVIEKKDGAIVEQDIEVVTPVSERQALDPDNPIAPEVQEVVAKKKRYTTEDIVAAQLEAVRNAPGNEPSTVTTTTTVIPDPG